ncbi:MAG: GNAT family N-acetyltransferase [Acidobacteria bacterium]|nr:GNAT family N-acetyltransferase [Acidobacteriota bacterium]
MKIEYKKLEIGDLGCLTELVKLYEQVFEMEDFALPAAQYLQSLLEKETVIFYVAMIDKKVVGGLTAHVLPSTYFPSSEVYIYDLAVETKFQRKGIGRRLINSLKEYCASLRLKEVFVQADLEDRHALDFYRATGGIAESVVHFSYELK